MSDADEIRNVLARLAQLADGGDLEEYANQFTMDALWEGPDVPIRGRPQLLEGAIARREAGGVGPGSNTRHVVTTTAVDVSGDEAMAYSYWMFFTDTASEPKVVLMGSYADRFERTSEGWKLAHRSITFG